MGVMICFGQGGLHSPSALFSFSIYLSIHPSIHLFIHLFVIHSVICYLPTIRVMAVVAFPDINKSIRPSIHLFICSFVHSFIYSPLG